MKEAVAFETLRRRINRTVVAFILLGCVAPVSVLAVFHFGDTLGNACLYVGHRLKNAGTEIETDGMVSLVYLREAAGQEEALRAQQRREELAQASIETRVAGAFATKPKPATPEKGRR